MSFSELVSVGLHRPRLSSYGVTAMKRSMHNKHLLQCRAFAA